MSEPALDCDYPECLTRKRAIVFRTSPPPGTCPGMAKHPGTDKRADFHLDVERRAGGHTVVSVGGDVDLHSGGSLRDRLATVAAEREARVTVDLTNATFLDSMALGVLLAARKHFADAGAALDLVVATPEIRRVLEITMLDRVFEIHPSRAEALAVGGAS